MRLGDITGQDRAVTILRRALAARRVAHAYLFEGPRGVGKRSTAIALGAALCCPQKPYEGCGACDVCRRIAEGVHPDVITFASGEPNIVVDDIRPLTALAGTRPHEAPARVVVIDAADRMNRHAANALLKTLEEPAPGTHFVLVTAAPGSLLSTIRSRTQSVRFDALQAPTVAALLGARGVDAALAETVAPLADGSMERATELAATDAGARWQAVDAMRAAVASGRLGALFDAAAASGGDKEGKAQLAGSLSLLARFYRDALVVAGGAPELAILRERETEVERAAAPGAAAAGRALAAVLEAQGALEANVHAALVVERMLLELGRAESGS